MSDLGDIGGILDEKPVSNLDWLDIDEDEYREAEDLPEQNLDAVPELVEQWKDLSEEEMFRLSPENRAPDNPNTPFWSERPAMGEVSDEAADVIVEKFAKRHVQAGVSGPDLISILQKHFARETLVATKDVVRKVLAERGLLGSVYIDSDLFEDCYKGGPQENLNPNNRTAKFVLAKSHCGDCIHNREGRCSVFNKEIVFEVDYTENLLQDYLDKLESQGKKPIDLGSGSAKARLQKALLKSSQAQHEKLDSKPIQHDPTEGITYEEAVGNLRSADVKQEIIRNHYTSQKVRKVAKAMMNQRGPHSSQLRDLVASDVALSSLQDDVHLLGNLYLDLSHFATYREASEFFEGREDLPPVAVGIPYEETELDQRYAQASSLDFNSDAVLMPTLRRYFLTKVGRQLGPKSKKTFKKLYARLKNADEALVRRFARRVFSDPVSSEVRQYEATLVHDPTKGVTSDEADKRLREAEDRQEVVENPKHAANRKEVVARMLIGDHGAKTATLIQEDGHLSDLQKHLHLLGNLYVDTEVVDPGMAKAASEKRPELDDLLLRTPNNKDGFFEKPEVHASIAKRIARLKGVKEEPLYTKFLRSIVSKLEGVDSANVRKFAQRIFAQPLPKLTAYETSYGESPKVEGAQRMQEFELGNGESNSPMSDFDLHGTPEGSIDIEYYGDGLILE